VPVTTVFEIRDKMWEAIEPVTDRRPASRALCLVTQLLTLVDGLGPGQGRTGRPRQQHGQPSKASYRAARLPTTGDSRARRYGHGFTESKPKATKRHPGKKQARDDQRRHDLLAVCHGRYWARTSDLRLVEAALSQLS